MASDRPACFQILFRLLTPFLEGRSGLHSLGPCVCKVPLKVKVTQLSPSVVSDSLWAHGPQQTRPLCPSPTPGVYPNSCPLSQWCHPAISSSVIPFSCPQSFPALGSFQMSQLFTSGGQRIGVSALASVLPMNIQDWFPLGWTGWISLLCTLRRLYSFFFSWRHEFRLFTKSSWDSPGGRTSR